MKPYALLFALLVALPLTAHAQEDETSPKYEFRGTWIATVANLDWPTAPGQPVSTQRAQLLYLLDELEEAGINAVFFQVRAEADAYYASDIEPWAYYLTGQQGETSDPTFDPLAFAIEEGHKRGMEVHAWFNPYRADRGAGYPKAETHVTNTHPEWILSFGNLKILDPGLPEVRDYVTSVVMDVTRRYDIDGVHFDDYFYPYPPNTISDQDDATFAEHSRGFTSRSEWRRDNINLLIQQVSDSVNAVKPYVKFGVSPFGIWKSGVPAGIVGMDAHNTIYADARAWLDAGSVDYLAPQLYWAFGGGQDFGKLAPWWGSVSQGRHIYAGHGVYKSDSRTFANSLYSAGEVPRQIRFTRDLENVQGSIHFRAQNLARYSSQGFADSLSTDLYSRPALTPPMPWKWNALEAPEAPGALVAERTGVGEIALAWSAPEGDVEARRYAVYRVGATAPPDWSAATADASNLVAVTGTPSYVDHVDGPGPYYYAVTAVSGNSVESSVAVTTIAETGVAVEEAPEAPASFSLLGAYPNPFNPSVRIAFELERPAKVSLEIYDAAGRRVATLMQGRGYGAGRHEVDWFGRDDGGAALASGTYLYVIDVDGRRASDEVTLIK